MAANQPRVLHVLGGAAVGGTERQLLLLLQFLSQSTDARLLLIRGGPLEASLRSLVPTTRVEKRGKVDPVCVAKMVAVMRRERPDVVHTWGSTANLWGSVAARLAHVPGVVVSDGSLDDWKGRLLRRADAVVYQWADAVVGNSSAVVEASIARGADPEKTRVIGNGVMLPVDPGSVEERDPGLLLYLGRLHPDKGPDVLLEAFAGIAEQAPWLRLAVVGPAEQPAERRLAASMREAVSRHGLASRVELVGAVTDPVPLLRSAAMLVVPSRTEGFPNVVLEAMAHGTPVVATSVGGVPTVVRDGVTGRLVPAHDPEALGVAILEVAADPDAARARARAARQLVANDYAIDAVAATWSRLYLDIADRGRARAVA